MPRSTAASSAKDIASLQSPAFMSPVPRPMPIRRSARSAHVVVRHSPPGCRRETASRAAAARSRSSRRTARRKRARAVRASASPPSSGQCEATAVHFAQRPVAMEHEIAAGCERPPRPLRDRPDQGAHRNVVTHQRSGKSDKVRITSLNDNGRGGGRKPRIDGCEYDMGGHAQRQSGRAA